MNDNTTKKIETFYKLRNNSRPEIIPDSYLSANDDDVSIYSDIHELEKKYELLSKKTTKFSDKLSNILEKRTRSIIIPNDRVYVKNFQNEILYEVDTEVNTEVKTKLGFEIDEQKIYLSLYPKNKDFMYGIFFTASPADFINIDEITKMLYNTIENKHIGTHIQYSKPIVINKETMKYENTPNTKFNMVSNIKDYKIKLQVNLENIYNNEEKNVYNDLLKYIKNSTKYKLLIKQKYKELVAKVKKIDLRDFEERILTQKPYNILYPINKDFDIKQKEYKNRVNKFLENATKNDIALMRNYIKNKINNIGNNSSNNSSNKEEIIINPVHKLFRTYSDVKRNISYIKKDSNILTGKRNNNSNSNSNSNKTSNSYNIDKSAKKEIYKFNKVSASKASKQNYDDFITITQYIHYYYKFYENTIKRKSKFKDYNIYYDNDKIKIPVN